MRVLVVEDDPQLGDALATGLRQLQHVVDWFRDGARADAALQGVPYDAVVLDLGLPGGDGMRWLRQWRGAGRDMPVLILTARDGVADRVAGLDAGADDYLVKPFGVAELLARMRVALRRRGTRVSAALTDYRRAAVHIDLHAQRVWRDGAPVHLTPTEFALLARLVRQAGQVVTHRQLLRDVWGAEFTEHTHYLRLYMGQLRAKLEDEIGRAHV